MKTKEENCKYYNQYDIDKSDDRIDFSFFSCIRRSPTSSEWRYRARVFKSINEKERIRRQNLFETSSRDLSNFELGWPFFFSSLPSFACDVHDIDSCKTLCRTNDIHSFLFACDCFNNFLSHDVAHVDSMRFDWSLPILWMVAAIGAREFKTMHSERVPCISVRSKMMFKQSAAHSVAPH